MKVPNTKEGIRLLDAQEKRIPLALWGPYLSERQWGTVREDYSTGGQPWQYFPFDDAASRVYLWGEDGIAGLCDYGQNICFSLAMWNGKDAILKERLFGLANGEGNHGEDVKELYYHLDNTPTHSYMKYLYKMPQAPFPYKQIRDANAKLSKEAQEYEILDTGIFDDGKYFDVFIEYAKQDNKDIHIKITAINRGPEAAPITLLPTVVLYNRWQYGGVKEKPFVRKKEAGVIEISNERTGTYQLQLDPDADVLFTENETNFEKVFGTKNKSLYTKDAFHDAIITGANYDVLKQKGSGTKCCSVHKAMVEPGGEKVIFLRLVADKYAEENPKSQEDIFQERKAEADEFYQAIIGENHGKEVGNIQRLALAGLMWSKQYYHYDVQRWLRESDGITPVSEKRSQSRNSKWKYLKNQDVLLMPDKWEYPWFAAWDTAFQCIALSIADPFFAKHQLILLMREWFMHPNGQLPSYEWDFSDINPPVHAFAALKVYKREHQIYGSKDLHFLKSIFQKLIINFTWWVNKVDNNGNNIFEGGFLGLDNIGVFNRSWEIPEGVTLDQADGTSWVGMYALNMMEIAVEIAKYDLSFEDSATKFYEHFVIIADALNSLGLWNEEDSFFYDMLTTEHNRQVPIKVRSVIGVSPLFDVTTISVDCFRKLKDFHKRYNWFNNYRNEFNLFVPNTERHDDETLLSMVKEDRLKAILKYVFDEAEFLSDHGIRSVSKYHEKFPYTLVLGQETYSLSYNPGDSTSNMFGGNSNWRGPVWMPINHMIITSLKKYGDFYGDDLKMEFPTGSGEEKNLRQIADALTQRLLKIFLRDEAGDRPLYAHVNPFYKRPENKDLILFHEYFNGETGRGLGASHQTGWTAALVDLLI